jgi:hypothetical protein
MLENNKRKVRGKDKEIRNLRRPIATKIGEPITDVFEILNLAKSKKSIVFSNIVIPASVICNWSYSLVLSHIEKKYYKYYNNSLK